MEITHLDTRSAKLSWGVFRDGPVRAFLCIWVERQIARIGKELEAVSEADLKNKQGQIAALRVVRSLLECSSIETVISDIVNESKQ